MAATTRTSRSWRALLAVAVLVTALVVDRSAPAGATADVTASRIAGANRYATARSIAVAAYPNGAATVVLASGETFPDALAGSALAGALGGPIVLTAKARLSPEARDAIDTLGADRVIILGGTGAVSSQVEVDLDDVAVSRVAGPDRYGTAAAAAARIGSAAIAALDGKKTALVASGTSFADALAGGGIANNGFGTGVHPVLLAGDSVPASTSAAIDELGIQQVMILGGTAAVSSAAEADLVARTGNPAIRLAGANRYATAATVAQAMVDRFASPATTALLASGEVFADALAGGVLSGVRQAPILLTPQAALADESEGFLVKHSKTVGTVIALGGSAAVSPTALDQAERAAESASDAEASTNDDFTVTPATGASQLNNTTRTYSVTGLSGTDEVDIVLLPCANVTTTTSGRTFRNTNTNAIADAGAQTATAPDRASTPARITRVNGEALTLVNDDYADDVDVKSDGTLQLTIAGPTSNTAAGGCVRPIVFDDDDTDEAFDVTTANPGLANESFGAGGTTTFGPQSSSTPSTGGASLPLSNVTSNDEGDNSFVACNIASDDAEVQDDPDEVEDCTTYFYDSNDTFFLKGGTELKGIEAFETRLSTGDDVGGRYFSSPSGSSRFTVDDEAPSPPTMVGAEERPDGEAIEIVFLGPSNTNADEFWLLRKVRSVGASCPDELDPVRDVYERVTEITGGLPGAPYRFTDERVEDDGTYCYAVVTIHQDDTSDPSEVAEVAIGEPADERDPTISSARGSDLLMDGLGAGDSHQLVFSEEMEVATDATYTVKGKNGFEAMIVCGATAECQLSGATLLVFINDDFGESAPDYELEVIAASGIEDLAGNPVDVAGDDDDIEGNTLE